MQLDTDVWMNMSERYAFLGNSFMAPMNNMSDAGISADFWSSFVMGSQNEHIENGIQKLQAYALEVAGLDRDTAVQVCAVEYTKLFVGPPSPQAPPWETLNTGSEERITFGAPTFGMREILREAGLELKNENNQYEDHIGIELLYLAAMCARLCKESESNANEESPSSVKNPDAGKLADYIQAHPLSWIETLRAKIDSAYPEGYYSGLAELAQGLLEWHLESLGK